MDNKIDPLGTNMYLYFWECIVYDILHILCAGPFTAVIEIHLFQYVYIDLCLLIGIFTFCKAIYLKVCIIFWVKFLHLISEL